MPQTNKPTFTCPACGKHFAWKPEIAGKKAKCSCGSAVEVPLSIDPPPPEPEPEVELIDFADNDPEPVAKRAPAAAAVSASTAGASECPICLETIPAGQHRCPSCGYDVTKSGGKVHAAPAMAAGNAKGSVTAGMPGRTPVAAATGAPHHESRIPQIPRRQLASAVADSGPSTAVKVGLPILAVLVLVGAFFGFKHFQGGGKVSSDGKPLVGDDQAALEMMNEYNGTEINEWLQTGRNHKMVMGMTLEQAEGFGKARYAQGAKKVYAFAVVSTNLVVELPDDAAKRKALIDNYNGWMKEHFAKDPITDIGQHYLIYKMHV
jgi:hypothetical protein